MPGPLDDVRAGLMQESDSIEDTYELGRQVAHERYGTAVDLIESRRSEKIRELGDKIDAMPPGEAKTAAEKEFNERWMGGYIRKRTRAGGTEEDIVKELSGLEEPWIDPTAAFGGGFGVGFRTGYTSTRALMPSLGRALLTGVVGGAADYPVGMATEQYEEHIPMGSLPFNILVGMISGATVERRIEKAVIKAADHLGIRIGKSPEAVERAVKKVKLGNQADELTVATAKVLQDDIQAEYAARVDKVIADKVGSSKPEDILSFYQDKYPQLKGITISTLDATGNEGAIRAQFDAKGNLVPDQTVMVLTKDATPTVTRHEIEHLLDAVHGKVSGLDPQSFSRFEHGRFPEQYFKKTTGEYKPGEISTDTLRVPGDRRKPLVQLVDETTAGAGLWLKGVPKPSGKALNISLSTMDTTEDIDDALRRTATVFKKSLTEAKRGVVKDVQARAMAEELGIGDVLGGQLGEAWPVEKILAARQLLLSSATHLSDTAHRASAIDARLEDKYLFRKALNLHYAIQAQVTGAAGEAGRALRAFQLPVGADSVKIKYIQDLMETLPGGPHKVSMGTTERMAKAISQMDDPRKVNKFSRQVGKAHLSDMVLEAWINGLVSGPQTHAVNILSNTLVALWQIPERLLASGISKVLRDDAIKAAEARHQAFGMIQGFRDGLWALAQMGAGKALRKEELVAKGRALVPEVPGRKVEARRYRAITAANVRQLPLIQKLSPNALEQGGMPARAVDFMGEIARLSGSMLMAEDDLFKTVGYRMELWAQASRKAASEGLTGPDLSRRISQIVNDPANLAPEVHLAAIDAARYQTFTQPLGAGGQALMRAVNNQPWARVILPFIRTPTNILKFAGERMGPAGLLSSRIRADIAAGGAKRDLALARMSMGGMVMAYMATLASDGSITGGGPADKRMQAIKRNTGWQPYSVKIGDKYYAYNRLEPLGMLFGLAADYTEIVGQLDQKSREELGVAIVAALSKNLASKTWLRGISEFVRTWNEPERYGSRYLQKLYGTAIPTGVAQLERTLSPELEAVYGFVDSLKSRIPGYSSDLPPRRNMWGEIITLEGGVGPDIVSPIYTSTAKSSPIDEELLKHEIPVQMPRQTQHLEGVGVPLEPKEYDRFIVLMNTIPLESSGETLKSTLDDMVQNDPTYLEGDRDQKETMIRYRITEARTLARMALLDENDKLRIIVDEMHDLISSD